MTRLPSPRGWMHSACRCALLATLAFAASQAAAGDAPGQITPGVSRHAARQVRIPQEKPTSAPTPARKKSAVQPAAHYQPVASARTSQPRPSRAPMQRTAARFGRHEQSVMVHDGEVIQGEPMLAEEVPAPATHGGMIMEDHGYMTSDGAPLVDGPCYGGACNGPAGCGPNPCCLIPCPRISLDNVEFFAGADGFSGPLNRGQGGSFGFHEGANWGNCLPCQDFLSAQLGFQAVQSTFNGNDITDQDRRQFFVTGGFFRRVDWGLQGGAVVDFLHDEWYYEPIELLQVRGEVSWVFPCDHEIGVWFTQGINNAVSNSTVQTSATTSITFAETWHSNDVYAFFYRRQFANCGASGRIFGGFTGESDGLVGADFQVPLCESLALRSDFAYLIPNEGGGLTGNVEESWNVSVGLVWYPGCRTATSRDYNRPLLNVANNGTFFVDRD